jgi:hypothetical protein
MEASCTSASLFAGADVETDCLTFVEEIPRKEVQQIEVEHIYIKLLYTVVLYKINIELVIVYWKTLNIVLRLLLNRIPSKRHFCIVQVYNCTRDFLLNHYIVIVVQPVSIKLYSPSPPF